MQLLHVNDDNLLRFLLHEHRFFFQFVLCLAAFTLLNSCCYNRAMASSWFLPCISRNAISYSCVMWHNEVAAEGGQLDEHWLYGSVECYVKSRFVFLCSKNVNIQRCCICKNSTCNMHGEGYNEAQRLALDAGKQHNSKQLQGEKAEAVEQRWEGGGSWLVLSIGRGGNGQFTISSWVTHLGSMMSPELKGNDNLLI